MSKTFKSAKSALELTVVRTNEDLVRIITQLPYETGRAIDLAPSDAPALMQAIVECLPPLPDFVRDGSHEAYMAVVVTYLDKAVRALEAETAEAKEQAELEAEALELYNTWREVNAYEALSSFSDGAPIGAMAEWLAVARRAREMRKS